MRLSLPRLNLTQQLLQRFNASGKHHESVPTRARWLRLPVPLCLTPHAPLQDVAHLLDAYRALLRDLLRTPAPFLQQPGSRPPPAAPSPEAPQDPVHLAELCEQQPAWHREAVRRQQQEVGRQQEEHQEEQVQGEQQEEEEQQQQQQEGR